MSRDKLRYFIPRLTLLLYTGSPHYGIDSYQHSEGKFGFLPWEGPTPLPQPWISLVRQLEDGMDNQEFIFCSFNTTIVGSLSADEFFLCSIPPDLNRHY